ncbi:maltose alpha-D-glucosyltransferase [Roseospirillum parvum]|uniref:Maltokinase n=1 Tax=Roseospirillum parvum TaxID=83401 RepID=A0A1G7WYA9_9PROT|nr:maltose alpha-D-glucosyltransferase [Roseospirillum parvum]SDG76922.1 maltose alpha-D-glucosyltransferase/ alpha-amylase [Roseospirillum parvum]
MSHPRPTPRHTGDPAPQDDPLWYKDAVIYQLHVKAFFDFSNDGIGDFAGLTQKLDYLVSLGVNAVWVLPFYPSPLRDDGYDIADYKGVHPAYGRLADFKAFVKAAHARGLKVITELVINHTSDQHRWFQRARRAKPGSAHRNFYVWSDDDRKWPETRIIFTDTETSNWTWDPVAQQYYWHRFFSHQPDLNFDNPRVLDEVIRVMKFWLDTGVDGMRLDAIPYLVERDGTNNENLPETHAIIKRLRAWIDEHYPGRMLLGEANQWPEDVRPYFGDGPGDECNMAFHFPLMPRMYMALAQEDRHPITDIMRQTPDIPATAQWAIFLRNHDELTLEMVTDRERDYLWNYYAAEPRARINLGIRRRLAPLVDNDRRKIELLNSLLMSMPGTPIVYYGDELGMGDNIYLGDRDGVRTPMQWSSDRNGGFSRADPQRLYLPAIQDAIYGFATVNVEAQAANPSSLLNWMRRLIAVRRRHKAFGRGHLDFLYPGNRKVLAYLRRVEEADGGSGETILCVANLSRAAQPVELDLSAFKGRVPVELMGRSAFPPIGDLPYFVTLPAYAFYWFLLAEEEEAPIWHEPQPPVLPEFVTLVLGKTGGLGQGKGLDTLTNTALPDFLPRQRWFGLKGLGRPKVAAAARVEVPAGRGETAPLAAAWRVGEGEDSHLYFLPLAAAWESRDQDPQEHLAAFAVAKTRQGARAGLLVDAALGDLGFVRRLAADILAGARHPGEEGAELVAHPTSAAAGVTFEPEAEVQRLGADQSNTSLRVGEGHILKLYRRLEPGIHPEVEMGRFLTDRAGYANIPAVLGHAELTLPGEGGAAACAILQAYVANQGDGWSFTLDYLDRFLEEVELLPEEPTAAPPGPEEEPRHAYFMSLIATLGRRIGELHRALAEAGARHADEAPDFAPEPLTPKALEAWAEAAGDQARAARQALKRMVGRLPGDSPLAADITARLDDWKAVKQRIAELADPTRHGGAGRLIRLHGDLHLGQVVIAKDDFFLLDFEGEPARSLDRRRARGTPMADVAGMLRSFDYAAWAALFAQADRQAEAGTDILTRLKPHAEAWQAETRAAFLDGYAEAVEGCPGLGLDPALIDLMSLTKALYEIAYEAANRPDWLSIPLGGLAHLLAQPVD